MKRFAWLFAFAVVVPVLAQAPTPRGATSAIDCGLSPERLARIAPAMNQLLKEGKFPGMSVAVARNGQIAYQQEFGFADLEKKQPLRKDTIYRVFSMTKPVTGVAVMMLLEEGRFVLDDPVSKYMPCFKDLQVFESETGGALKLVKPEREVTIRDLLRQTSGFTYGGAGDSVAKQYQAVNLIDPTATLDRMVTKACSLPLRFQPGSKWEYGVSIDILGRLVEVISGQPLDVFMQKRIFEPLRMVDTGFFVPDEKAGRFANCYTYSPRERTLAGSRCGNRSLPRGPEQDAVGRRRPRLDGVRLPSLRDDAGARGRAGWRAAPRPADSRADEHGPAAEGVKPASWGGKNGGNGYGLTMSVTTEIARTTGYGSVGDFGWDGAASTFFRVDPKERLVVLVMTQRMPTDLEIQVKVKTLVYQALLDE